MLNIVIINNKDIQNQDIKNYTKKVCDKGGACISTFRKSDEFIQSLRTRTKPDVIIMDMQEQLNNKGQLRKILNELNRTEYYILNGPKYYERISCQDIIYVKKDGHYLMIHTNYEMFKVRDTLYNFHQTVNNNHFIYIEQGCIVNMRHIIRINNNKVCLKEDLELLISRSKIKEVYAKLDDYWHKN